MTKPRLIPVSALAIARAIASGTLSPAEALQQSSDAIAAHDPLIGAFVVTDPDIASAPSRPGPLSGLAVGIKDVYDTADFATAMGSSVYAGNRPRADAAMVSLAKRAGASAIGKTVTTELQYLQPAATRNPRHLDHTPGGSSSGSAAAVAAGMVPLAIGSQTGGSVIRPAAFCGVAGFKPSFRLLPTVGLKCFSWSLDTAGLFGAGVADVAYFAESLTGRPMRVDRAPLAAPRLGIIRTHLWHEASEEMREAVEAAARLAETAGATLVDIELAPIFADAFAIHPIIQNYQAAQALAWELDTHRADLSPILCDALDEGLAVAPADYDRARGTARRARMALKDLLADVDAILTPSAPGAAPEGFGSTGSAMFNRLWTLLGTPAVNVPGFVNHHGLPLGVQVISRFGRDAECLAAAAFVENAIAKR